MFSNRFFAFFLSLLSILSSSLVVAGTSKEGLDFLAKKKADEGVVGTKGLSVRRIGIGCQDRQEFLVFNPIVAHLYFP